MLHRRSVRCDFASGLELRDRHQHVVHFALHVARRTLIAVTQQPHELAHRLAGALIGNPVNHDDGDAIGFAHGRVRSRLVRSTEPAVNSPEKTAGK